MRSAYAAALAAILGIACFGRALAVTGLGEKWSAEYVAAYQPTFGHQGVPFVGDLSLTFNNGIITGTYRSFSSRPDPYYGRIINVTGGMSHGSINLRIGSISVTNGTIDKHGDINGSATWNGKIYTFAAKPKRQPTPAPSAHPHGT